MMATASPVAAQPKPFVLSGHSCNKILERMKANGFVSKGEVQALVRRAKRAAGSKRKEERESAAGLLGQVLAHVDHELETAVSQAQVAVDEAQAEGEALAAAQAEADARFGETKQAVADVKTEIAEAEKAVELASQAIANTKNNKKSVATEVKTVEVQKRQLEDVEANIFRPLKEARVDGSVSKQLRQLCKVGEKHGLHRELMTIAPAVLKKQLDKRRTFDNLAVRSLDTEFEKHVKALGSKIKDNEQALAEQEQHLQSQQSALLSARAQRKERRKRLALVEADLGKGQEALALARKKVRKSPTIMKHATCELERAKVRISKFRTGPLATYLRVLPLPKINVAASADETEPEDQEP